MPGYKLRLQNNEEPSEGIKCSYCRLIMRDPIQTTESGQRYCRECFKEAVRYAFLGLIAQRFSLVWRGQTPLRASDTVLSDLCGALVTAATPD